MTSEAVETPASNDDAMLLTRLRRFVGIILAVYWIALFTAMHVRIAHPPIAFSWADKVVHFVGYGVLGLLLTCCIALWRPLSAKVILTIILVLGAYGVMDELLQIPVGRTCDFADWVCDLIGGSCGVFLLMIFTRKSPRRNELHRS